MLIQSAAEQGMRVENILIEGRENTDPDLLLAILNTREGEPLLDFDPAAAQALIEQISWVKTATVVRRLPNTIYVRLVERIPYALWQDKGKVVVIDQEGVILTDSLRGEYSDLPILGGEGAAQNARELIELLKAEPSVYEAFDQAFFIGGRRWDIKLENGITVQLPAQDIGYALGRLARAVKQDGLFKKDISVVDLRQPERVIVEGN